MAIIPAMSAADFGTGGTAVMNYGMQIGKDLAAYGEKIGLQIKDNRDKQQAMGSLPALQEAMQSFQAGQSGAGYSSIINLAAQDPSNPYVQNLVKL
jgi:putative ribosome biogenesis GTPase RsgA